jgi:hypothetical protein
MDNFQILGYSVIGYKENKDDDDDDGPNHKSLSDRVGGTTDLGCNHPSRTLRNQTKGI